MSEQQQTAEIEHTCPVHFTAPSHCGDCHPRRCIDEQVNTLPFPGEAYPYEADERSI